MGRGRRRGTLVLPRYATDGRRSRTDTPSANGRHGHQLRRSGRRARTRSSGSVSRRPILRRQSILFAVPAWRLAGAALAGGLA